MLIWDCPEAINSWVGDHGGGRVFPGACTALGWADSDGKLIAGLVFYNCNGVNLEVNIALSGKTFPIGLLKAGLHYVFSQLKVKRLTFTITEANIASQTLVRRLGAFPEATLRDAAPEGDLLIFALFPSDCKIWSRINGKISGQRAPST